MLADKLFKLNKNIKARRRKILLIKFFLISLIIAIIVSTAFNIQDLSKEHSKKTYDQKENNKLEEPLYMKEYNDLGIKKSTKNLFGSSDDNSEIEIQNLDFKKVDVNGNELNISSNKAYKNLKGIFNMENIETKLHINNKILSVYSKKGYYNPNLDKITLFNGIYGNYLGFEFFANNINMLIEERNISSEDGILFKNDKFFIKSNSLKSKNNEEIQFEGDVKTYFNSVN